jgi:hypothetical protein
MLAMAYWKIPGQVQRLTGDQAARSQDPVHQGPDSI